MTIFYYLNPSSAPPANTATLAAVAGNPATAMGAINTPPAVTVTLGAIAADASMALGATNTPPADTATLEASAGPAVVAITAQNTAPANTVTLGAAAGPAAMSVSALEVAPGSVAFALVAGPATGSFAASNANPPETATLAGVASDSALAFSADVAEPPVLVTFALVAQDSRTVITAFNNANPGTIYPDFFSAARAWALADSPLIAAIPGGFLNNRVPAQAAFPYTTMRTRKIQPAYSVEDDRYEIRFRFYALSDDAAAAASLLFLARLDQPDRAPFVWTDHRGNWRETYRLPETAEGPEMAYQGPDGNWVWRVELPYEFGANLYAPTGL